MEGIGRHVNEPDIIGFLCRDIDAAALADGKGVQALMPAYLFAGCVHHRPGRWTDSFFPDDKVAKVLVMDKANILAL